VFKESNARVSNETSVLDLVLVVETTKDWFTLATELEAESESEG